MSELEFATRDQIIAELAKRFDSVLMVTLRHLGGDEEDRICDFRGGPTTSLGLARAAQACIEDLIVSSTRCHRVENEDEEAE